MHTILPIRLGRAARLGIATQILIACGAIADEPRLDYSRSVTDAADVVDARDRSPRWDSLRIDHSSSRGEHPLDPVLQLARSGYQRLVANVKDYTCVVVRRERVNGVLTDPETIFSKVRHESPAGDQAVSPMSVYLKFQSPAGVRGREVLFSNRDENDGMLVRKGGKQFPFLTVKLKPTSPMAMHGNLYPITEFGIKRLVERMIDLGEKELAYEGNCEVRLDADLTFEGKSCTCVEVCHPVRQDHLKYHLVRIFIDNELQLPIRFESYDWPEENGEEPILNEEYTYRDLQLNVGLEELDFQSDHPDYRFSRRR